MALPVFRPTVKRKDMGSVLSCIVSDRLGPGEISRDLASRLCHLLGHAGGVTLASSYLAVSAALEALGLAAPDGVILPALAPAAWLRVLRDRGLVPLVADVDPESGSLDPARVSELVSRGAKAIMVPHTAGIIVDVEALRVHGLPIVEDASAALGGKNGETPCGSLADICLLSMDPESIVTCGGGAVVLGRSRQTAAALRRIQEGSPLYSPMPDMNAALGISQVAALDTFVQVRREVASAYRQALLKSRHKALTQKNDAEPVLGSFPVVLASGMKDVRTYALKKNVDTLPAFAGSLAALGSSAEDSSRPAGAAAEAAPADEPAADVESPAAACPNARSLALRCLLFPLYPMLGKRDVEAVCRVLSTMP